MALPGNTGQVIEPYRRLEEFLAGASVQTGTTGDGGPGHEKKAIDAAQARMPLQS